MIFNLLLAAAVATGLLLPEPGLAVEPYRRALVIAVMFLMAVTLPAERLRRAAGNVRGLGACFGIGYVLLPLACAGAAALLGGSRPGEAAGLVVLGALPCTLASATLWTRLARGDDALALTYTVLSNLAAVLLLPAWLLLLLGSALPVPTARLLLDLTQVVLLPVAAGQIARALVGPRAVAWAPAIGVAARALVLTIVLVAVSRMAPEVRAEPAAVLRIATICALLHSGALAAGDRLALLLGAPVAERRAVAFAGSQKTLFVGVFLAGEYFPGQPLALLPVTSYHVLQLVIDTVVAGRLARSGAAD